MKCIVSPETYFILWKADMHQEHELFDQKEKPDHLALGGIYEVLEDKGDFYILKPEKGSKREFFKTPKYYLKIDDNKNYNFHVDDYVFFLPICSELEIKSLTFDDRLIIGHKYKITRIINYYYMELIDEKGEVSNPIRFCDVKPVE